MWYVFYKYIFQLGLAQLPVSSNMDCQIGKKLIEAVFQTSELVEGCQGIHVSIALVEHESSSPSNREQDWRRRC